MVKRRGGEGDEMGNQGEGGGDKVNGKKKRGGGGRGVRGKK